jgi:hypothetical protein
MPVHDASCRRVCGGLIVHGLPGTRGGARPGAGDRQIIVELESAHSAGRPQQPRDRRITTRRPDWRLRSRNMTRQLIGLGRRAGQYVEWIVGRYMQVLGERVFVLVFWCCGAAEGTRRGYSPLALPALCPARLPAVRLSGHASVGPIEQGGPQHRVRVAEWGRQRGYLAALGSPPPRGGPHLATVCWLSNRERHLAGASIPPDALQPCNPARSRHARRWLPRGDEASTLVHAAVHA